MDLSIWTGFDVIASLSEYQSRRPVFRPFARLVGHQLA